VIALAFATVGYSLMGQIDDPFGTNAIYAAIVLGIGEISVIVAAGTLMGQEARPEIRGAIVGVFGITGGLGIMAVSFAGGILFDQVGRTAPFIMMGILNGLLMLVALLMWFRQRP
jgi:predicted MFS family arabinose efflux permease